MYFQSFFPPSLRPFFGSVKLVPSSMASSSFFSRPFNPFNDHFWKKVSVGVCALGLSAASIHKYPLLVASDGSSNNSPWRINMTMPFACIEPPFPASFTEPNTGVSFASSIAAGDSDAHHQLAGTGLRKKNVLGLKSITVYAFGVYANENSLRETLGDYYTQGPVAALRDDKSFHDDIMTSDFNLTVRLVIVYGRLKVGSVRSAFEESIGSRIQKFSGAENRPLLESFTSLFKDDIKLPKGTTIDITRHPGHTITTKIDGKELGTVKSPLLCRAFLDLYLGDDPFDRKGKEEIVSKLASLISS